MKENANIRKWFALLIAIIAYYVIHEGAHTLVALLFGSFDKIRLLGLGVQVVTKTGLMSTWQIGIFSIAGSLATLLAAYLLLRSTRCIVKSGRRIVKAIGYYTTFALLLIDPIYLTFLYKFFGGGDMNGIKLLLLPEAAWQIVYGLLTLLNIILIIKYVYPAYKKAFA